MSAIFVGDMIVPGTNKTWKQTNAEIQHKYAVGDRVVYSNEYIDHDKVMYIYQCTRDCDETPLYTLSYQLPAIISAAISSTTDVVSISPTLIKMMIELGAVDRGINEDSLYPYIQPEKRQHDTV
jgi:hypothetical protein